MRHSFLLLFFGVYSLISKNSVGHISRNPTGSVHRGVKLSYHGFSPFRRSSADLTEREMRRTSVARGCLWLVVDAMELVIT